MKSEVAPSAGRAPARSGARPRVSIGLPVFDGARFLRAALDSLLAQTFDDFELIVLDNGSTDGTPEIVAELARRDARIRSERSPRNRGAAWSHNAVVDLARGEYFRWATHDDASAPAYLERCVEALDRDPALALARPRAVEIDERGEVLFEHADALDVSSPDPRVRLAEVLLQSHPCFDVYGLVRLATLRRTSRIGSYPSSDRVLLAELALHGPWHRVPEPLFLHRQHEGRSVRRFPSRHVRALWFDPSLAGRIQFPLWRLGREYWRGIRRAPLTGRARWRCASVLAPWCWRQKRWLAADLATALRQLATGERAQLPA